MFYTRPRGKDHDLDEVTRLYLDEGLSLNRVAALL
jgi:hypothetical protein